MDKRCVRVHLVTGGYVDGAFVEDDTDLAAVKKDIVALKHHLTDMAESKRNDGWQINMGMPNGGWAVFPSSSILYVEFVGWGGDD